MQPERQQKSRNLSLAALNEGDCILSSSFSFQLMKTIVSHKSCGDFLAVRCNGLKSEIDQKPIRIRYGIVEMYSLDQTSTFHIVTQLPCCYHLATEGGGTTRTCQYLFVTLIWSAWNTND